MIVITVIMLGRIICTMVVEGDYCGGMCLSEAVPYWFGEVLGKCLEGIFVLIAKVNDIVLMQ